MSVRNPFAFATAVAICALTSAPLAASASAPAPGPLELEVLTLVNDYRSTHGIGLLGWDDRLYQAAYAHSLDMAVNDCFQHDSCDGTSWVVRIQQYYPSPSVLGETMGLGYNTAESIVEAWKASEPHAAVLLTGVFQGAGVGLYESRWTMDFGSLPAVPEPGHWSLMALGLAAIASVVRRRRG